MALFCWSSDVRCSASEEATKGIPLKALALALCLSLTSCASIVSKSSWPVTVQSNPPGATVRISDEDGKVVHSGTTPFTVTLSSKEGFFTKADYDVHAELAGHGSADARMSAHLNAWYWGNIIFGGLIGLLIVDPATGAMWKLGDTFTVNLPSAAP